MQVVYVLNKDGLPLMPTHKLGKVRHLLKDGKAKVVKRSPFTIQLNYDCGNHTQSITLGVDAGSEHIGLSASTKKQELYCSDVELRLVLSVATFNLFDNEPMINKIANLCVGFAVGTICAVLIIKSM